MDNDPVVIERMYDSSIEKLWNALTNPTQMKQWYFDIPGFKPEVGFEFQFYGEGKTGEKFLHLCKIIEAIKNKKLKHSWSYDGYEGESFVTFELFDEEGKTRLKLTHEGLETFPVTAADDFAKANFTEGWTYITAVSLKEFLEK